VQTPVEAAASAIEEPQAVEVEAAEVEAVVAPQTSLIELDQAPLWPKEPKEWGFFMLDLAPIGMVSSALTGSCPAIGSLPAFVLSFVALNVSVGIVKFVFNLRRCGQAKRYPVAKGVADMLGLLMLGVGIWGIAITYPNLRYLNGPASECEFQPFLGAFIPSTIILIVLVVLLLWSLKTAVEGLMKPPQGQKAAGDAAQEQERDVEEAV